MNMINEYDTAIYFGVRSLIAVLAGFFIGLERTMSGHEAGIKTLVFVSLGSCIYSSLGFYLADISINIDPTRVIGQIVTGVGFLGAGVIVRTQAKVSGLTTAAIIWMTCSLGAAAGAGLIAVPICASITYLIIVFALKRIETFLHKMDKENLEE
jgi:putative Mg2+ transporter-C (MgtC) family protein